MAYRTVLVVGGTGFVGSSLVAELVARSGRSIVVPTRRYQRGRHLLLLPHVLLTEADVNDDRALARLLPGVDAVINLAGVLHSKRGPAGSRYDPAFARSHVELTRRLVAACAAHGVPRYLHMSAL
ncbi:MAG: NAD-dependent epimerase/dehydratase family protein, partial [Burkholderiaceae bacterium]